MKPKQHIQFLAAALSLALIVPSHGFAEEGTIECQLLYEIADGFYVDAGGQSRLVKGSIGLLSRSGQPIARIEVINVSKESSFLRLSGPRPKEFPAPGEKITLTMTDLAAPSSEEGRDASKTLKDRTSKDQPEAVPLAPGQVNAPAIPDNSKAGQLPATDANGKFLPLLAPQGGKIGAFTDAYNISKGQASFGQTLQFTPGNELNYAATHLRTSGSVERIQATPWAFEWSSDISYRDGKAYKDVDDYQDPRFELYRLAVYRKFDDQSWVRIGRFLSRELPGVGYLDGAQGEWVVTPCFRLGGMFGFHPERRGLDFSINEPTNVVYFTARTEEKREASYTGTFGLLTSMWNGTPDRLSILAEQTVRWEKLTVLSSSELDFDIGGAEVNEGPRLTRWDLVGSYPLYDHTTLRAGLDRYEKPDTEAERMAVPALTLRDIEFFHRAYTRLWLGASHTLPAGFRLSEEVSIMDADVNGGSFRWNASLTKVGLPFLPEGSSATATIYNLVGEDIDGYGGRLSGYIPFPGNRFSLQPDIAFRYLQSDILGKDEFTVTDIGCHAFYVINKAWSASGGVSYAYTEDVSRLYFDFAVTFKW